MDYYNCCDWDFYGFPGDCIFGDDVYIPEEYMDERWLPVRGVPFYDYWVSDKGRLWSNISQRFIEGTPNCRTGHIDISIICNGKRHHKYLHRMVAEAFIPNPHNYPLVRHLNDDPSDNRVENLAWGTSLDNVHDCIKNGHFRRFTPDDIELANQKRRTPIKAVHLASGREYEFISQQEASRVLGVNQSDISSVARGKATNARGYYFYYTNEEPSIDLNDYRYSRHFALIRAIDLYTGETYIFKGQTDAARELGVSVASVSMILSGKTKSVKGFTFEYVNEEGCNYGKY